MINCLIIDDEPLARETLEDYIVRIPFVNLLGSFEDPMEAMEVISSTKVDLVFSDIQMPEITGISFLKSLKQPPLFIFVSGHPVYAAESYELDVVDYIVKPFSFERLLKSVNKARASLASGQDDLLFKEYFTIKDRTRNVVVRYEEIHYLEGCKDYVIVATSEKEHMVLDTMKHMESVLPKKTFLRVQKSYIVNLAYVKAVSPTTVIMKGSIKDIPIGLQYRDNLYKMLDINKP